ncbi:homoserine O-acetyltransferase [Permianibacter sp. IMCC34836]|uniref:homoserine O-acetyltransferase MetX n=1 Tax=Permianibacter fluminis TaxID=2738515 RepID=UPI001551A7CB|nr:homoserine O-acetyltransferase [Permianibacter fluminis]NQD37804.1 homoserine O-acetyltransferase [Permianibacter fluminis]
MSVHARQFANPPSRTVLSPEVRLWQDAAGLTLENGERLAPLELAWRSWGSLNRAGTNAVLVIHALSGGADLELWWPELLGTGKPLDPARDFIVCINLLGSCYGSSGPLSAHPDDGQPWQARFPRISIRDQVAAQSRLLRSLGVQQLRAVIGPSLGGMIAQEFALQHPDWVQSLVLIGTTAAHSAQAIAASECQRAAIRLDPAFNDGFYLPGSGPVRGLALARELAFLTYRCDSELRARFGRHSGEHKNFAVLDYLDYQGDKFVQRFDANSYIRLTECMNSHDIGRDRGGVAAALQTLHQPTLVISLDTDQLYPVAEQREIARHLPNAQHVIIASRHGHDGFLTETDAVANALIPFLAAQPLLAATPVNGNAALRLAAGDMDNTRHSELHS